MLSSGSLANLFLVTSMQSPMGTEGKRASASKLPILSSGLSLASFISRMNSTEFLQTNSELEIIGLRMSFRSEARRS